MHEVLHGGPCVLVPGLARFPAHLRDLCAMLPVTDINGALFEALTADTQPGPHVAAGLFLTDPFLNIEDATRRLKAAGIGAVANFPTMQMMDGPSAMGLASVGHGFAQECAVLAAFAARGFAIIGYAGSRPAARELPALGCRRLVLLGSAQKTSILADIAADCAGLAVLFRHAPEGQGSILRNGGQSPMP